MKDTCHRYIPEEYTTVWDTFDISDMQSFLNDIEKRHEKNTNNSKKSMNHLPEEDTIMSDNAPF